MSGPEPARRAKRELSARLATIPGIIGIGLARQGQGHVVVVRLAHHVPDIPTTVTVTDADGRENAVTVRSEIVGTIQPE